MGIETLVGRVVNTGKFDNQWSLRELKKMDPDKIVEIEKVKKDRKLIRSEIKVKHLIELIEEGDLLISAPRSNIP
jgi:hypothetical protein